MDAIHAVVDILIYRLDTAGEDDLTVELLGVMDADQRLKLLDQSARLALCDEAGSLHGIHQQLQLRELEIPGDKLIDNGFTNMFRDDLHAIAIQLFKILIYGLAIRRHIIGLQSFNDLSNGKTVIFIRLLGHDLGKIQQFRFLMRTPGHTNTSMKNVI